MAKRKMEPAYKESLNELIDQLFQRAYDLEMTWANLAEESGLTLSTIKGLGSRKTKFPEYRTVELLAKAVGGKVRFNRHSNKITWTLKVFKAA